MITLHVVAAAKPLSHIPSTLPSWFGWVGVALIVLFILAVKRRSA